MTISSSVLSAAGPKKYNRIPSTISPMITQAIKRVVWVTVIIYSPPLITPAASQYSPRSFAPHRAEVSIKRNRTGKSGLSPRATQPNAREAKRPSCLLQWPRQSLASSPTAFRGRGYRPGLGSNSVVRRSCRNAFGERAARSNAPGVAGAH